MYLDGDTLRDALKQVLALPPEERLNQVANIFASVAEETWSSSGEKKSSRSTIGPLHRTPCGRPGS
jgi:adenylylsulfate kinase-like enzyme